MRTWTLFLLALLVTGEAASVAGAQTVTSGPSEMTASDVSAFVDDLVQNQLTTRKVAGAAVAVVKDGTVVLSRGYGRADVASGRSVTADTPFRIGSITNTFTALAVMQLVERGRLDLDRDVTDYVDFDLPAQNRRAPVTLRRLLSQQAGFENRIGGIGARSGERPPLGPFLARHLPPRLNQPDDVVAYSNVNAALAAYIVERSSGQTFEQYLDDHIFTPLGMMRTSAVQPPRGTLGEEVSAGYVQADSPPTPLSMAASTIYEVGSTGIVTSAADMARLMMALLEPDTRIVTRASLQTMMSPQAPTPRGIVGLGMFSPLGAGGNPFIGHDGAAGGFHSSLALLPSARVGVFASYNSDGVPHAILPHEELLQQLAERYFPNTNAASPAPRTGDVDGMYEPASGAESTLFRLCGLFSEVAVSAKRGSDALGIRPASLPFDERLIRLAPGLYRWSGRDVSFAGSGASAVMQIGSPAGQFRRVPWWASLGIDMSAVSVCLMVACVSVAMWVYGLLRRGSRAVAETGRLLALTRLAPIFALLAIAGALWLALRGWPLAAMSSPIVMPLTVTIYALAWTAVALTPAVLWHVVRLGRSVGGWRTAWESLLAVAHVVLVAFCLYWRIAGTSLDL